MIELLVLAAIVAFFLLKLNYRYWKKRGVPGPKPTLLLGNTAKSYLLQSSLGNLYSSFYNEYKDQQVVGIYRGITPVLLLRDPDLIKDVLVKEFGSFHDNDFHVDKKSNPFLGRNIFFLKSDEWRTVRTKLTPAFSSGKMKWLYPLTEEVCKNLGKFIDNCPDTTNGNGFEGRELFSRFATDNVASCAFGLEAKCFEDENNEFRQLVKGFLSPGGWTMFTFFLFTLIPSISKVLPVRMVPKKIEDKLVDIVGQTLKYRKENNVVRNDFLQVVSQLRESSKDYVFTDVDVAAQAAGFFGDGIETSSGTMSLVLFSLASNQDVQTKLREELNAAFVANNGSFPYDVLVSMPYLDAVVYETLRLYPALPLLQKVTTKPFTFQLKNSKKSVTVVEGTPVVVPLCGLHRDPKYFDEPDSFRPERMMGKNKENITKYTFLPFGDGPRICIGQRFGLLQIKAAIAHIIRNYQVFVNNRTQLPLKFLPVHILMVPVGGLWFDFKKIEHQ